MKPPRHFLSLVAIPILCAPLTLAQRGSTGRQPDLQGVYQTIPDETTLSGGLKNAGSPAKIDLLSEAAQHATRIDLKKDPWKMCQPVGPFRMMAVPETKIELVSAGAMIVMLFEDLSHGMKRTIFLNRGHPATVEPTWLGDSVGRWEGDTLMVDTIGFNDKTWLNEKGVEHSEALHLTERIRPMRSGQFLEYKMTAEDPNTLSRPYTYTRYFQKLETEVMDDVCQDDE